MEPTGPLIPPEPGHQPGFQTAALLKALRALVPSPSADSAGAAVVAGLRSMVGGSPYDAELAAYNAEAPPNPWWSPHGAYDDESVVDPGNTKARLDRLFKSKRAAEIAQQAIGMAGPTRLERALLKGEVKGSTGSRWGDALRRERENPALQLFSPEEVDRTFMLPKGNAARGSPFAGLKKRLRAETRRPEEDLAPTEFRGEPITREQLRARTDRAVVMNAVGRPENRMSLIWDPNNPHGQGYTEFREGVPITINAAKSGSAPSRRFRSDVLGRSMSQAESEIPTIEDWFNRRGTMAHELGERQVVEAERPIAGFSSHAGPSARLRQFETMGARSPVSLQATLDSIRQNVEFGNFPPSEDMLIRKWMEWGGTPSRPLPNDMSIAKRLAKMIRSKKKADPDFAGQEFDMDEVLDQFWQGMRFPKVGP